MGMTDRLRVCWSVQKQKRLIWRKLSAQNLEWHHTNLILVRSLVTDGMLAGWKFHVITHHILLKLLWSERPQIKFVWCHSRFWADNFLHINLFCFCTKKLEGGQSYPFLGFGKLYHFFLLVNSINNCTSLCLLSGSYPIHWSVEQNVKHRPISF